LLVTSRFSRSVSVSAPVPQRLLVSVDESSVMAYVKDLDGRYLHVNRRYQEFFGVGVDDLLGRSDDQLDPRQTVDGPRHASGNVSEDEPLQLEYTVAPFDGRPALAVWRFAVRAADGDALAVCGVAAPVADAALARRECDRLMGTAQRPNESEPTAGGERRVDAQSPTGDSDELRRRLEAAETALLAERARAEDAEAAAHQQTARAEEAEGAARRNQAWVEEVLGELNAARGELASVRGRLEGAEAAAQRETARAQETGAAAQADRARAEQSLGAAHAELEATVAELSAVRVQLQSAQAELASERAQRSQTEEEAVGDLRRRLEAAAASVEHERERADAAESALNSERADAEIRVGVAERRIAELEAALADARAHQLEIDTAHGHGGPHWDSSAQRAFTRALSESSDWRISVKSAIGVIGSQGGWDAVCAWQPDDRHGFASCFAMWTGESHRLSALETATWQRRQPLTGSTIGEALAWEESQWLAADPHAGDRRLQLLAQHGIRGVLIVPVKDGARPVAALELLTVGATEPSRELIDAIETMALQLGHFAHLLSAGAQHRWRFGRM
jgi:hypothetical protein